jgi:hypothetical protein
MADGQRPDRVLPVVYLVREGEDNQELRWSLRTLANLTHSRVWLAGFQPSWTVNVERIVVRQQRDKWKSIYANLAAIADCDRLDEHFIMFNDDFFVMRPAQMAVWHRGSWDRILPAFAHRRDYYSKALRRTAERWPDGLCFDSVHRPMLMERGRLRDCLDSLDGMLIRSHYGNLAGQSGVQVSDCKVKSNRQPKTVGPFLSTNDSAFRRGEAGRLIRRRWPAKSGYER